MWWEQLGSIVAIAGPAVTGAIALAASRAARRRLVTLTSTPRQYDYVVGQSGAVGSSASSSVLVKDHTWEGGIKAKVDSEGGLSKQAISALETQLQSIEQIPTTRGSEERD